MSTLFSSQRNARSLEMMLFYSLLCLFCCAVAAHSSPVAPSSKFQHIRDSACGETRRSLEDGDHGFFESPGYPRSYKGGLDCEWRYEGEPGTVIQATVFNMKTENALVSDISDSLYVSLNGNWNDSQRFSGDLTPITPMVFVSQGNALAIRFKTSRFTEGNRGFRIGYFVRGSQTGKPAVSEPAHDVYVVVVCNYLPVDHPQVFPEEGISLRKSDEIQPDGINRTNPNPYLVALVLDDNQFCSGTLISDRHVLTSAHCTRGVKKIDMIFGTDNLMSNDKGVQRRQANASSVIPHPNFDSYTGENDMSVIELSQPLKITRFVVPAALPTWSYMGTTFTGFQGEIVGWGDSTTGTVYSQAAKKVLKLSPNAACSFSNRAHTGLSMCSRSSPGATCQADSGSPIVASRAYCTTGPDNEGGQGGWDRPEKPTQKPNRPNKPVNPSKPGKPNKPGKPGNHGLKEITPAGNSKYQANVLLGLVSHGSCEKGFSFTRMTSQLDILTRFVTVYNDA